jgi:glycosyltransferase involved in cell wall biosynthesis
MPKISVCMATRNGERFLRRQIDSILVQLSAEDELIVSDDSSEDATIEIIKSYSDPRIRFLGCSSFFSPILNFEHALLHALLHARGEVIVLSDQDDVWLENKLPVIREFFRHGHTRQLIVLDGLIIDEDGQILYESIFEKIHAGKGMIKNVYNNTYLGCCMAFSRDLLDIALPFPRRIPMHDMWLGNLAALFGTVEFVKEKTIMYRRHGATLTDFRIKFEPLQQIRRRLNLVLSLAQRGLAVAVSRKKNNP